jgi:hypothetical protein
MPLRWPGRQGHRERADRKQRSMPGDGLPGRCNSGRLVLHFRLNQDTWPSATSEAAYRSKRGPETSRSTYHPGRASRGSHPDGSRFCCAILELGLSIGFILGSCGAPRYRMREKQPTRWGILSHSTASVNGSTSPPARPGCPSSSHPITSSLQRTETASFLARFNRLLCCPTLPKLARIRLALPPQRGVHSIPSNIAMASSKEKHGKQYHQHDHEHS